MKALKNRFVSSVYLWGSLLFIEVLEASPAPNVATEKPPSTENVTFTKTTVSAVQSPVAVPSKEEQNLYLKTFGHITARNGGLPFFGLDAAEVEQVLLGIKSAIQGEEPLITKPEEFEKMQNFFIQKEREQIENTKKLSEVFLKAKDSEAGIKKMPSGLRYKIIKEGDAVRACEDCTVEIDYEGRLINGKVFDSTYKVGERASFYFGWQVIPGFREAVSLIGNGGEIQAFIPAELGYGDENFDTIPGGSVLDFTIKVHKIISPVINPDLALATNADYEIFALSPEASREEAKKAYERECAKHDPSKKEDAEKLQNLEHAYQRILNKVNKNEADNAKK
ncbi:MAG: FKBP-type peptidyl-prolyl cis-trans isomerase [Puniceicoccales bacterium]|jgi:FKBP-type peptidyl-prolyl cis-trans isomerase|nr:FKBP-type peptidyl-prolyl cis-trans isomerase [Puniceicoccales bacterium]